ncbi:hypothetical protein D3C85_730690 [compost metagenome]
MAEFGVQATTLPEPQAAGSSPVAPVQQQYINDSVVNSPLIGGIVDIFAKGLELNRKEEAKKAENAIIGEYVREETAINNAISTGQLSPATAASRSRANANKYYANYPGMITEFEKAGKALKGFTEKGDVEEQLDSERKLRDADKASASTAGFIFTSGMPKEIEDAQIRAHKTNTRAQRALEDTYKANNEARAAGTFNASMADREQKEQSIQVINSVAGDNMAAFQGLASTLVSDARSGKITFEEAQIRLNERYTNIASAITSAARLNPELATPYRSLFNETNDVAKKMLDPKSVTEGLEDELKRIQTRLKLVAFNDPASAALITTSNLLGNNPMIAFQSTAAVTDMIARISQTPGDGKYVPPVVGNPDVEGPAFTLLKSGMQQLKDPKTKNVGQQKIETDNSVNAVLKQVGNQLNMGATPQTLKNSADFFASPEYAGYVTGGKINPEAAQAAKRTFQVLYEPAVVEGVRNKLQGALQLPVDVGGNTRGVLENIRGNVRPEDASARSPNAPEPTVAKATAIRDAINVVYTGAGVQFEMKNMAGLSDVERIDQRRKIADLNTAQKGINQLIHIAAHMEGSTDYAKYWENNKHIWLPEMFSKYKGLEIGDVKNGMRYLGGDANQQSSWEASK